MPSVKAPVIQGDQKGPAHSLHNAEEQRARANAERQVGPLNLPEMGNSKHAHSKCPGHNLSEAKN